MGVHDGHRARIRDEFKENGLDSFSDIRTLEFLLFYSVPRADTNEIAHALLNKFGSLDGVFSASMNELQSVKGIGENSAILIKLFPSINSKLMRLRNKKMKCITSSKEAKEYFFNILFSEQDEVLFLVALNSKKQIISSVEMNRGVVNSVSFDVRKVCETALKLKADSVIIAHNHPEGTTSASQDDLVSTNQLKQSLSLLGIELVDHIIVTPSLAVSFADSGLI